MQHTSKSTKIIRKQLLLFFILVTIIFLVVVTSNKMVQYLRQDQPQEVIASGDLEINSTANYLAGVLARKNNDMVSAAKYFQKALKDYPNNPELLETTFKVEILAGNVGEAVALARKYQRIQPENTTTNMLLGMEAFYTQDFASAEKLFTQLQGTILQGARNVDSIFVPLMVVWSKAGQGKYDEAIAMMHELIKQSNTTLLLHYHNLAMLYDMAGKKEEAEQAYQKGLQSTVLPYRFVKSAGNFFERSGAPDKAKALYEQYRKEHSPSTFFDKELLAIEEGKVPAPEIDNAVDAVTQVLMEAISLFYENNLYQETLAYLQMVLYLKPDFEQAYLLMATTMEQENKYDRAIQYYAKILPTSDFYSQARISIARAWDKLGQMDKAKKLLIGMIAEDKSGNNYEAILSLADIYRGNEAYPEAIDMYSKAIAVMGEPQGKDWILFYARGICYERDHQWSKAEQDFLQALALQPEQPDVLNYLAYSWIDRKEKQSEAIAMLEKALALKPNDPHILDSMGWALYSIGKYEEAASFLEAANTQMPYDAVVNEHLGDVYWKLGRKIEARFEWQHALDSSPPPTVETVEKLKRKLEKGVEE